MRNNPNKHRLPPFDKSGVLLVNKPATWTSHDVVGFIRSRFNVPKVGHCGTLDPAATGLLVVVLGKFTKLSQKFSGEDKTYEGRLLLGTQTDSQDMDGEVVKTSDYSAVTKDMLQDAFANFTGNIMQIPPMVSAKKHEGDRLYTLARKGVEVKRDPLPVTIHSIRLKSFEPPYADFEVSCSKGTYVRTLCADIGEYLGCGACLFSLNRIRSGEFLLEDAYDIETMKTWEQPDLEQAVNDFLFRKIAKMAKFTSF